jgi:hypothetical protein
MKIDMSTDQPTIDAADLGTLLGLDAKDVRDKMQSGDITTRLETGEGEDAGRMRLTFYYDGKRIRLTCTTDGTVLSTIRTPVGPAK